MGYFSYIASSYFLKTADGKSLFLGARGPFSKPYLIETPEKEAALKKKIINFHRIFLPLTFIIMIVGMNFLLDLKDLFLLAAVLTLLWWLLERLWVSQEIKNMKKYESKISLHQFYKDRAAKSSLAALWLGFICSCVLLFVALAFLWPRLNTNLPTTIYMGGVLLPIIFLASIVLALGYMLLLKLKK